MSVLRVEVKEPTPKPRAYCHVCHTRMPLRDDGTLPFHGDIGGMCAGSEKKP